MVVAALIALALSVLVVLGGLAYYRMHLVTSSSSSTADVLAEIEKTSAEAQELTKYTGSYASKDILAQIERRVGELQAELKAEGGALRTIEEKLDNAQKNVENRESHQQELKTSREEDEKKLEDLMNQYTEISAESMGLEQQLAASLKNLDVMMGELELTDDQRAILAELSNFLTVAGGRLRDLLMEYQAIHDRLENLRQQHHDLEDEYTRLVEQQLGE